MEKKIKWFSNNNEYGYIKYQEDGTVSVYLYVNGTIKEFKLK